MTFEQAQAFGSFLRKTRLERKLSVREVGRRSSLDGSVVSRYETGQFRAPDPEKVIRLGRVLGVSMNEIFGAAGFTTSKDWPDIEVYLKAKYPALSDAEIQKISISVRPS